MKKRAQPGYYPGFSTLSQRKTWDAATRELVDKRVLQVPAIRFFSPHELPLVTAVFDRLLPQDDRIEAYKIPIVHYVDEKLYLGKLEGYRHEDMPLHPWAIRRGLVAIEATARELHDAPFVALDVLQQEALLLAIRDDDLKLAPSGAGRALWNEIAPAHFWTLILGDAIDAYYAHPWAWDEVGFGGPAYPRGYMRLENGEPEPWESPEKRYAWDAPEGSLSVEYRPLTGVTADEKSGQGGSH